MMMAAAMLLLSGTAKSNELQMGIHRKVNPHLVQASPQDPTLYLARTASGCHVILSEWQGDFVDPRHSDDKIQSLTLDWTGACDAQGYATGKGRLVLKSDMSSRERGYAWSFTADSSFTMKDGIPTGPSSDTRRWSRDETGKPLAVTEGHYMSNGCIGDSGPYRQKCPFDAAAWRMQLGPQKAEAAINRPVQTPAAPPPLQAAPVPVTVNSTPYGAPSSPAAKPARGAHVDEYGRVYDKHDCVKILGGGRVANACQFQVTVEYCWGKPLASCPDYGMSSFAVDAGQTTTGMETTAIVEYRVAAWDSPGIRAYLASRPARPPPAASPRAPRAPAPAPVYDQTACVSVRPLTSGGTLLDNSCGFRVKVSWCATGPVQSCTTPRFAAFVEANDAAMIDTRSLFDFGAIKAQ